MRALLPELGFIFALLVALLWGLHLQEVRNDNEFQSHSTTVVTTIEDKLIVAAPESYQDLQDVVSCPWPEDNYEVPPGTRVVVYGQPRPDLGGMFQCRFVHTHNTENLP
tara:strand:- start:19 stop:345 length:327 start_codon:yes stop_codon:yes gene_type:complete